MRKLLTMSGVLLTHLFVVSAQAAQERPNILFIFSDDHAYQAISAYNGRLAEIAPTPNIDRIANQGMRFDRATVTNSICGPSRAVILTGKHSHLNGMRSNRVSFDGSQATFPKILQTQGYDTSFIGKWHLRSAPTGFDHWQILLGQGAYYNPTFRTEQGNHDETGYVTDIITDKSLNWLKTKRNPDKPFLLMMQHKAPHREWMAAKEHLNDFNNVSIPEPSNLFDDFATRGTAAKTQNMTIKNTLHMGSDLKVWNDEERKSKHYKRTYGRMNDQQREFWDAAYDEKNAQFVQHKLSGDDLIRWKYQRYMKDYLRTVASVDDSVGEVLDYLKASGLDKNTLVVYSSDQGFYLGEHGWFDKRFMYEQSFRTPLLIKWPGHITPGSTNKDLVSNLDYAQTILDIAGVKQPDLIKEMQGMSLKPLLTGAKPKQWRKSLYYRYYEYPYTHKVREHDGVSTERYKLIRFHTLDEWELYDLKNDPAEMNNIYHREENKKRVADLKTELIRLRLQYRVPEDEDNFVIKAEERQHHQ
jgi:arylsulfatase A-like enzyme